jgi:hypothetical protein
MEVESVDQLLLIVSYRHGSRSCKLGSSDRRHQFALARQPNWWLAQLAVSSPEFDSCPVVDTRTEQQDS